MPQNKYLKILLLLLATFCSVDAFASADDPMFTSEMVKYFAYFFGVSITVAVGTMAQSKVATAAMEGIARNPSADDKFFKPLVVSLALMESLVILMFATIFFFIQQ